MRQQLWDIANAQDYASAVGVTFDNGQSALKPGEVILYNDSRFNQSNFSQPLTSFAVGGWNKINLAAEVEALTGRAIPTPRRFSHKVWDNTEALVTDAADDLRAVGGDFKVVRLKNSEVERKTLNRGLAMILDRDEISAVALTEEQATNYLMGRIMLNIAKRAFDLLSAAATNTNRTWNNVANPDADMRTTLRTAADISGLRPNSVVFGDTAFDLRRSSYEAQATAGAFGGANDTADQIAAKLRVDRVFVSNARYSSSTTAKTAIVASKVLSFYADNSGIDMDPSNIRRFYTPNQGAPIRVFRRELSETSVMIGVEHFELLAIPYTGGIRQETIS